MSILRRIATVGAIGFSVGAAISLHIRGLTAPSDFGSLLLSGLVFFALVELIYGLLAIAAAVVQRRYRHHHNLSNAFTFDATGHGPWLNDHSLDGVDDSRYNPDPFGKSDLVFHHFRDAGAIHHQAPAEPTQYE